MLCSYKSMHPVPGDGTYSESLWKLAEKASSAWINKICWKKEKKKFHCISWIWSFLEVSNRRDKEDLAGTEILNKLHYILWGSRFSPEWQETEKRKLWHRSHQSVAAGQTSQLPLCLMSTVWGQGCIVCQHMWHLQTKKYKLNMSSAIAVVVLPVFFFFGLVM